MSNEDQKAQHDTVKETNETVNTIYSTVKQLVKVWPFIVVVFGLLSVPCSVVIAFYKWDNRNNEKIEHISQKVDDHFRKQDARYAIDSLKNEYRDQILTELKTQLAGRGSYKPINTAQQLPVTVPANTLVTQTVSADGKTVTWRRATDKKQ